MKNRLFYWFNFFKVYQNWPELLLHRFKKTNATKVVLKNGLTIKAFEKSPLSVISDEIFVLNRYTNHHKVKIKKGDIVVDIGAHVGVFSIFAATKEAVKIFSYEPDINSYKKNVENCKNNNMNNISIKNLAVTNSLGKVNLYLNKSDGRNSVFSKKKKSKIQVKSTTLRNIFKEEKIKKIDFLKLDCEGSEGLIFESTPIRILQKINKISMEYHNNLSSLNNLEIKKKLEGAGFFVKIVDLDKYIGYIYAWR